MRRFLPYEKIPLFPFEDLPPELCSEEFFRCGETVNLWIDAAVREVLDSLGNGPPVVRRSALQWLRDWNDDAERTTGIDPLDLRADGSLAPTREMISRVTEKYADFLRGKEDGERILFAPGNLALWQSYFSNDHRVVWSLNLLGAFAAGKACADRDALRILEIGGGLGSAAEALLERLGGRTRRYLFTDVQPGFLRRGADRVKSRFPGVALESALFDIEGDLPGNAGASGGFDLIYGVNVLHLAGDLLAALGRLKRLLAPGGALVFVEGTRPAPHRPIAAEFIFQLLPQFTRAGTDREYRPRAGFLTGAEWIEALRRAGFGEASCLPDPGQAVAAYPNHAMGACIAR